MVFSTIESSVNKSGLALNLFGKQLSDIQRDFSTSDGIGNKFKSGFSGVFTGGISKSDLDLLKKYNDEIKCGIPPSTAFKNNLLNVGSATKKMSVEIAKGTKSIDDVSQSLKATSISSKAAAVGMKALNIAMNMGLMLAITGLIQLAVKGFDALTVTFEEQQEKVDGLKQKFEECTSKIETLTSQLEENRKKITEINANPLSIVDSTTLTTLQLENVELERQLELNKQITKDTNKQLGVETSKLLEKESQKSETKKTTLEESTVDSFNQGTFGGFMSGLGKLVINPRVALSTLGVQVPYSKKSNNEKFEDYVNPLENTESQIAQAKLLDDQLKKLDTTSKNFTKNEEKLKEEIDKNSNALKNNISWLIEQKANLNSVYEKTSEQENQINAITELENAYLGLQTLSVDLNTFEEIWDTKATNEQKDKLFELAEQGKLTAETFKTEYPTLNVLFEAIGLSIDDTITKITGLSKEASNQIPVLTSTLKPLNISLTDITDKTSILATAWKEMDEAGEVTISTIAKMIETDANWADSIEIVNGKITINKNTLVGSARAIITAKKQEALAVIEGCEKQIQALQLSAKAAQQTAEQFVKSSSYISLAAGMAGASGKMYADQMNDLANGKVDGVYDLTKEIAEARKQTEIFDTMLKSLDGDDPFKTIGDSAKKAADEIKKAMSSAQSAINSLLKMTMDMIKQKYTDEKDALQKLKDAEKDRYDASKKALEDAYEQEKKTHDLQKQAIEDAKNGAKAVLDLKLKALQAEKDAYYWSKELAKQNKSVADLEADIASIGNDDSDEGIAKRRELEALLAAEKEKLADMQFDKSIERQEDSLNDEYNLFEETQSNKLDILDKQNQHKEELHQAELERLEKEYNTYIDQQDSKIKAIDEYTKLESNIRAEAIKMIEDKNSDLYRKLLAYNKTYGTGIQQDVTNAWNNAQTSLQHFGGEQFKVLDTLNMLAQKMNDFDLNIKNATNSARDLSNALKQAESIKADLQRSLAEARESLKRAQRVGAGNSVYQGIEDQIRYLENQLGMYHIGGVVTKNGNQKELYPDLKPDEVVAKLKVGETVLSPDDPNRARKLMANFINSDMSLSDFMGDKVKKEPLNIPNITRRYDNTDFSKYQRVSNSSNIDIKQGDIIIQGNADKSTVMDIKKLTEGVTKELLQQIHRNGHGNLKPM